MTTFAMLSPMSVPSPVVMPQPPYKWLVLDIETTEARPEDADAWVIAAYRCESFGTWTNETIGKRIKEAWEKRRDKLALLNTAPIICVSIASDSEPARVLHCMSAHEASTRLGDDGQIVGMVEGFPTQRDMLLALRALLDARADVGSTVIAGHNIRAFDLPKLRLAYLKARLRLPQMFSNETVEVYDTMSAWKRFSVDGEIMPSVASLLQALGIESHKGIITGEQIPQLYAAGQFDEIVTYSMLDVIKEADLYQRMTGQSCALV